MFILEEYRRGGKVVTLEKADAADFRSRYRVKVVEITDHGSEKSARAAFRKAVNGPGGIKTLPGKGKA